MVGAAIGQELVADRNGGKQLFVVDALLVGLRLMNSVGLLLASAWKVGVSLVR